MKKKAARPSHSTAADTSAAVDAFMQALDHPFKAEIQALRRTILGAAPGIRDGIKWNAPSFRTTDYFATVNLREKSGIGIILHRGAKAKALPADGLAIEDPGRLLKWLGRDRAMVVFRDGKDLAARTHALAAIVGQWLKHV